MREKLLERILDSRSPGCAPSRQKEQPVALAENECLRQDDIRLFHKGGCHIFAVALKASLPDEGYTLKRVRLEKDSNITEAYHVFASRPGFVIDTCGIKREEDYRAWLTARHQEKSFGTLLVPFVSMIDTSEEELLAHHHEDTNLGAVNRLGLFLGRILSRQRTGGPGLSSIIGRKSIASRFSTPALI